MSTFPDGVYQYGGVPVGDLIAWGAGHVYYVMQTTNSNYTAFANKRSKKYYDDGTALLHTTIQSALDACTANRNDYVIVMPDSSDYDLTEEITMSKARTHLIAPSGLGKYGMSNSVRLHQTGTTDPMITISADTCEVAGFFFKFVADGYGIVLSGTRWCEDIHDNFFGFAASSSGTATYGVGGTGAISLSMIHDNYFTNYSPGAMTGGNNVIAAFISLSSNGGVRNVIKNNILVTGVNTEVTAGILSGSQLNIIDSNRIWCSVATTGQEAGVYTLGISAHTDSLICNNVISTDTANNAISGGTADRSCVWNMNGVDGGSKIDSGGTHAT